MITFDVYCYNLEISFTLFTLSIAFIKLSIARFYGTVSNVQLTRWKQRHTD